MKDLMNSIMSIDHAANDKLNEAIRKKEERLREIDEQKVKLSKQIEEYADNHLLALEESEQSSAQGRILEIKTEADAEKARLQGIYDEKNSAWVSQIVSSILLTSAKANQ